MRVLFINPPSSFQDRYGALEKIAPTQAPLGLAYLAAVLERRGDEVSILDAESYRLSPARIASYVKKNKFDVVGVTMTTPGYFAVVKTLDAVSKVFRGTLIVGGAHMTVKPKDTLLENRNVDCGMIGEAELTIVELMECLEKGKDYRDIKGIAYRKGEEVIINPPREYIEDLDSIPMPARHLLPMHRYRPAPSYYRRLPSYAVLSGRGCPFRCTYCSMLGFGKRRRHHSVERVCDEIELLEKKYGAKEVIFRDDTFTVNREHVKNLCREMIRRGIHKRVAWSMETRVNLVDWEFLRLLKRAGCWEVHFGVESGNQRLLDLVRKDIKLEDVRKAFAMCRRLGIVIKAFFMIGLPTETREESLNTIAFAKELDPTWVQFTITTPYPGTRLHEQCMDEGTLKNFDWDTYKSWSGWTDSKLPFVTKGRNEKELKALQKRAMREFYLRPRAAARIAKEMQSWDALKAGMQGAVALVTG